MEQEALLKEIGLTAGEAKVYLALLSLGKSSVAALSRQCGIKRPTVYLRLKDLKRKGLAMEVTIKKHRSWATEKPGALLGIIHEQEGEIQSALPQLLEFYQKSSRRPHIRYFEGKAGVLDMNRTLLAEGLGSEMMAFQEEVYTLAFAQETLGEIAQERIRRKIWMKIIVPVPETTELKNKIIGAEKGLVDFRLLERDANLFRSSVGIFENFTWFVVFIGAPFAVLIESKELSKTFESILNLYWDVLKKQTERELLGL